MQLIIPLDPSDPEPNKLQRCGRASGSALFSLTNDEAEFIDTAAALIVGEESMTDYSDYVDRKLWHIDLLADATNTYNRSASRHALYRESIAAVQAHAQRTHGRRFQQLSPRNRLEILAQLEAGELLAGTSRFQMFITALVNDAVEAYFDARRPQPLPALIDDRAAQPVSSPSTSAAMPRSPRELRP